MYSTFFAHPTRPNPPRRLRLSDLGPWREWHRAVLDIVFRKIAEKYGEGEAANPVVQKVVTRRLQYVEEFMGWFWRDQGIPFEKPEGDPEDIAALILWPRQQAIKLASKMFPTTRGGPAGKHVVNEVPRDMLPEYVGRFNMDWFQFAPS